MTFIKSVKTCFIKKPFTFKGRASRSEFWWFTLFFYIACFVLGFSMDYLGIMVLIIALGLNCLKFSLQLYSSFYCCI